MRNAAAMRAGARIRLQWVRSRRIPMLLALLTVLAVGSGWRLSAGVGRLPDGAMLGLLAAGGWGLGLIPVHADRWSTGPARRRAGEPVGPAEAEPPIR
ncbi:hypothetical protein [Kitasatospora purpeofusca]|uniref:hypothetical protein n=1 Tax=Kitasatospora purpeofusca TaxID=67352 RepID=UPI002A5AACF8|nr:hypothetical protein [Kitasatospora purpeofusca]MDY0814167.1 hypothetical protein [Kitasatospora purpeofusca]